MAVYLGNWLNQSMFSNSYVSLEWSWMKIGMPLADKDCYLHKNIPMNCFEKCHC